MAHDESDEARPIYAKIPLGVLSVVLSGLIVFSVTTYYTDVYKQPSLQVSLIPSNDNKSKTNVHDIQLRNDGRISATNMRLTLSSSSNLTDLSAKAPIENLTSSRDGSFYIIEIPRFAPGTILDIEASFSSSHSKTIDYNIYATFDQGSLNKAFIFDTRTNIVSEKYASTPLDFMSSPITVISTISSIMVAIAFIVTLWLKKRYSENKLRYTMPIRSWKKEHIPLLIDSVKDPIDLEEFNFHNNGKSTAEVITSVPRVSIGIFGEPGSGKTTLMHCIEEYLKPVVFNWENVPDKENMALINYIKNNFEDLSWINERSSIKKNDSGNTVIISGEKIIEIKLDEQRKKASLICENISYYEFLVQNGMLRENDILTVWLDASQYERDERSYLEILLTLIYHSISDHPIYTDLELLLSTYLNSRMSKKRDKTGNQISNSIFVDATTKIQDEMSKIIRFYPTTRIVVFIENIEKCSPEKVFELLGLVKSYNANPGFVFILSITSEPFLKLFNLHFGAMSENSFEKYIRELIQVPITIPKWKASDISHLIHELAKEISAPIQRIIYENIELIVHAVEYNPMKVKMFLNDFIIATKISSYKPTSTLKQVLGMEILKSRWPDFYNVLMEANAHNIILLFQKLITIPEQERARYIEWDGIRNPSPEHEIIKKYSEDKELCRFIAQGGYLFLN